jgi:ParB-like chromosome segregation protein Spo0J
MSQIILTPIDTVVANPRNARTHSRRQIKQIANSIKAFGFVVPIVVDEHNTVIAGHGRLAAAKTLSLTQVPTVQVTNLSPAKKRALAIADNKISDNAGWDREILAIELPELSELLIAESLEIEITGFAPVEIDRLVFDLEDKATDPADELADVPAAGGTSPI